MSAQKFKHDVRLYEDMQILELLKEDKKLTRDELENVIGVSSSAIKQYLSNLQNDKLLKRVGGRKDGYWEVLDDI